MTTVNTAASAPSTRNLGLTPAISDQVPSVPAGKEFSCLFSPETDQEGVQGLVASYPLRGNAIFGAANLCLLNLASTRCGIKHIAAFYICPDVKDKWDEMAKVIAGLDPEKLQLAQMTFFSWISKEYPLQKEAFLSDFHSGMSFINSSDRLKRICKIFAANQATCTVMDLGNPHEFDAFLKAQADKGAIPHALYLSSLVNCHSCGSTPHEKNHGHEHGILHGRYQSFERSISLIPKNALVVDAARKTLNSVPVQRVHVRSRSYIMPLPCQCPLKEALKKDDYDEVVYYIGRGANSKRLDPFGFTFLSTMAERGNYNAMRALLDSKVDVDIPNSDKSTPLFSAVLSNDVKAIALLASRGADVNATGIQKMTALHQAAAAGTKASARALIKLGAKRDAKDSSGYTPFDLTNSPLTPIYKKMRGTSEYVGIQKLLQDGCPGGRAPALLAEAAASTAGRPESKDQKGDKKAEDGKGN